MNRDDIHGPYATPPQVERFLLFHSSNPYGEPMYRLPLAQQVMTQEAGEEQIEWAPETTLAERGGIVTREDGTREQSDKRPIRRRSGMRWVNKYPSDMRGWILQRWYPCEFSRASWESPGACQKDGTPLLGPYPEYGTYELVAGPCAEAPSTQELGVIIEQTEYTVMAQLKRRAESPVVRINRLRQTQALKQAEALKKKLEMELQFREEMSFMSGSSLEAGRLREQLAGQIRARGGQIGHVGN